MTVRSFSVIFMLFVMGLAMSPCVCQAGPANSNLHIPGFYGNTFNINALPSVQPNAIPQLKQIITGISGISSTNNPNANGSNTMTIYQSASKAIIDWSSFNIGSNSSVYFDAHTNGGNSTWTCLNRIWDLNPSQIYGNLRSDGQIYLINQNGILFGPGSQINVNSLVASALNIRNLDFLGAIGTYTSQCSSGLCFYLESGATGLNATTDYDAQGNPYSYSGFAPSFSTPTVANYGTIVATSDTNSLGSVFLIGPNVENWGTITAHLGQIALIGAIGPMTLAKGVSCDSAGNNCTSRPGLVPSMPDYSGGTAWNGNQGGYTGQLIADEGVIGMYGQLVRQDGIITAVTAVRQNGQIELRATTGMNCASSAQCGIFTGPNSQIISDIAESTDTAEFGFPFNGGVVNIGPMETLNSSNQQVIQLQPPQYISLAGYIYAPSGYVNINAGGWTTTAGTTTAPGRVFIDSTATIDVSGKWSTEPASDILLQAQLNSIEMQDAYAQQGGVLKGQYITFNPMTWPLSSGSGSLLAQQLNVTGTIASQLQTGLEKAINGGYIWITSGYDDWNYDSSQSRYVAQSITGDIIVKQGAVLNISGGGIHYSAGDLDTTQLVAVGGKIYNINNAPANLSYSAIVGTYTEQFSGASFNTAETWTGLYYGGGSPMNTYVNGFDKGGNAGSLNLDAATVVLEGQIVSAVTQGQYQSVHTNPSQFPYNFQGDIYDAVNLSYLQGTEVPSAGEVIIDTGVQAVSQASGYVATSISVVPDSLYVSPLAAGFNYQSTLPSSNLYQTVISAKTFNGTSLSNLTLNANSSVTIASDVNINLQPGGYITNQYSPLQRGIPNDNNLDHFWLNITYSNQPGSSVAASTVYYTNIGLYSLPLNTLQIVESAINDNSAFTSAYISGLRGQFNAQADLIEVYGGVTLHSGLINLGNSATTSIFLGAGSTLDVSGMKIDNSLVGKAAGISMQAAQFYQGGNIILDAEASEDSGIYIQPGAVLDVSGGYAIGTTGKITGGNAGSLSITAPTVMLNGDIRGYALPDSKGGINGGTIQIQAFTVDILANGSPSPWPANFGAGDVVPQSLLGTLVLPGDYFTNTGFTSISLLSTGPDITSPNETGPNPALTIEPGAQISTSLVRLRTPLPAAEASLYGAAVSNISGLLSTYLETPVPGNPNLVVLDAPIAYQAGASSFTAGTAKSFYYLSSGGVAIGGNILLSAGASIMTGPGGAISFSTNSGSWGDITVAGVLNAPGGAISLTCKGGTLDVTGSGQILAPGYTYLNTSSLIKGYGYNYGTHGGGTVSLNAGDIVNLEAGSVIDISGSHPVTDSVLSDMGTVTSYTTAGGAGTLNLTYATLSLDGTLNAGVKIPGVQGGTLSLTSNYNAANIQTANPSLSPTDIVNQYSLSVNAGLLNQYLSAGFDALTFTSDVGIQFTSSIGSPNSPVVIPRQLTLNSSTISVPSNTNYEMYLQSPWIVLSSAGLSDPPLSAPSTGGGQLTITAASSITGSSTGFIDLAGPVFMSGFKTVTLAAFNDIRSTDVIYNSNQYARYSSASGAHVLNVPGSDQIQIPVGILWTAGDLVLQADRIYPAMMVSLPVYSPVDGTTQYSFSPSTYTFQAGVFNSQNQSNSSLGTVFIKQSAEHVTAPVYSAGGQLIVVATQGIDIEGTLAAPMGQIILSTAPVMPQYNLSTGITNYTYGNYAAADSTIYIGNSGMVTTAGSAMVPYGTIDTNGNWTVTSCTTPALWITSPITDLPVLQQPVVVPDNISTLFPGSVNVNSSTIVISNTGRIDTSGTNGGSVFPLLWRADITGSQDPLLSTNLTKISAYDGNTAYIIKPGVQLPGPQVYLTGGGGLSAGYYSLLPVQYAFQPGAYMIELQSNQTLPGLTSATSDGYPLVTGYYNPQAGTANMGTAPQVYSIKPVSLNTASDYLIVGHYAVGHYDGLDQVTEIGNSGNITITADTAVISGSLIQNALSGINPATGSNYTTGSLNLSGQNVVIQPTVGDILGSSYQYGDPLPASVEANYLFVSADSLSGGGNIYIGGQYDPVNNPTTITNQIVVMEGSTVIAPLISLWANNYIDVQGGQTGTLLHATTSTGTGEIDLATSQSGSTIVEAGATLYADHIFSFDTASLTMNGTLKVDNGAMTLKGTNIYLGGALPTGNANYIGSQSLWDNLASAAADITLLSSNAIYFQESFGLWAKNSLTLDTSELVNQNGNGTRVILAAPTVNLMNAGASALGNPGIPGTGNTSSFIIGAYTVTGTGTTYTTTNIAIGGSAASGASNNVLFANFGAVNLNATGDLTLMGMGSLTTGNAPLNIVAARIATSGVTTGSTNIVYNSQNSTTASFIAPNFNLYTGSNYSQDSSSATGLNPQASITISGSGATPSTSPADGGTLAFWGTSINVQGFTDNSGKVWPVVIQSDGGTISLNATGPINKGNMTGSGGIYISNGGQILVRGNADAPGGQVTLQTDNGGITLGAGSMIDVSAGSQGDAGTVSLLATGGTGTVNIAGNTLNGTGNGGFGGSFVMNANQIVDANGDITNLINTLAAGGFTESVNIRTRTGNLTVASNADLTAYNVSLTADGNDGNGYIYVNGMIDASAYGSNTNGGSVELCANNDININGTILARASGVQPGVSNSGVAGAIGGSVLLNSENGFVNVNAGGSIDVSGGPATAAGNSNTGGTVYLRAQQDNYDVHINVTSINTTIVGASAIYAEAFKLYNVATLGLTDSSGNFIFSGNSNTNFISNCLTGAQNYLSNNIASARLNPQALSTFHLIPGIEVVNPDGDININAALDLTNVHVVPGALTLRAYGNLNINANLVDYPSYNTNSYNYIVTSQVRDSWGFNLVAGSDLSSANYMAAQKSITGTLSSGNLNINNNAEIYTENAPINFASAGDTVINIGQSNPQPSYMINNMMRYNIGSYAGSIQGAVGRDLVLTGGSIQTATGDINISVGGDLYLNTAQNAVTLYSFNGTTLNSISTIFPTLGSIRTTGQTAMGTGSDVSQYWTYADGGSITLNVGGAVTTTDGQIDQYSSGSPIYATSQKVMKGLSVHTWKDSDAWDYYYYPVKAYSYNFGIWGADYVRQTGAFTNFSSIQGNPPIVNEDVTEGLATMAGGNLYVRVAGDFLAQAGTFGTGNLAIYSSGNVKGRFLSNSGKANINAMGNFGYDYYSSVYGKLVGQDIELFSSQMTVTAGGDILLGAVVNPTFSTNLQPNNASGPGWNLQYTQNTGIYITAGSNITYFGSPDLFEYNTVLVSQGTLTPGYSDVMPQMVSMNAKNGSLQLLNSFYLAPSSSGGLSLNAGGSIDGYENGGQADITMSDIAPEYVYALNCPAGNCLSLAAFHSSSRSNAGSVVGQGGVLNLSQSIDDTTAIGNASALHMFLITNYLVNGRGNYDTTYDSHVNHLLYSGDANPVTITTTNGDIESLNIQVPEKATISAGRDIMDVWYYGQNLNPADVSLISAGRNIELLYSGASPSSGQLTGATYGESGLWQAGPGTFIVQAGGYIDLGTEAAGSRYSGIVTVGNSFAPGNALYAGLGDQGSQLVVISGYNVIDQAAARNLFNALSTYGSSYASDKASGNTAQAALDLQNAESAVSNTLQASGQPTDVVGTNAGDIDMDYNIIQTISGVSDIFIFAANNLNIGKTAITPAGSSAATATGIITTAGGSINIFAKRDVNVNESRVITDYGGNITVWSDQGNINAGRGSKTQIYVAPLGSGEKANVTPGAEGSGIRALTYDPDGPGPLQAPPIGDILLVAPTGIVNAGEAGISGGNVIIAATQVLNSQNITFSAGSVGVPQAASAPTTIGSLSGVNSTTQSSQTMIDASGAATNGGRTAQVAQMIDDFIMKWLDVKVIDFVQDNSGSTGS